MRALVLADRPTPGGPAGTALLRPVAGVPLLARQMRALADAGVRRLTVAADGPQAPAIADLAAGEAAALGLMLDPQPTVQEAPVVVVDGPVLFDLDLARLAAAHAAHAAALTVVAQPTLRPRECDLLAERDGRLAAVFPKDRPDPQDQRNLSPAGLWLAGPGALPGPGGTLFGDVLPALLAAGRPVAVHQTTEYLVRIDDDAARAAAERDLAAGRPEALRLAHRRPALLVDVDGVLNHDPGPQGTLVPDDIVMVDGAGAALARARAAGFVIAAITNRAQVARGDVSFEALDRILGRLEALLAADGGYLDRIYVCPHHPGPFPHGGVPELVRACECRKPGTLLFRRAFAELPIDPARACMVGDSTRDVMAAHAVGIPGYGVMTGHGCRDTGRARDGLDGTPDRMFPDIGAAVDAVLAQA